MDFKSCLPAIIVGGTLLINQVEPPALAQKGVIPNSTPEPVTLVANANKTPIISKEQATTLTSATLTPVSPQNGSAQEFSAKVCRPIARVVSEPMPLPGQTSRSSANFDLSSIRVGETFQVRVVKGRTTNYRIRFNLKRDIRGGIDPILSQDMRTGLYRRVNNSPLYPVYIADPKGAGKSRFAVRFCRN